MRSTQPHPIGNDFKANIVQKNFEDLYELAHNHHVRATDPAPTDGEPGDIIIVDDGTDVYISVKTTRGWFKSAAFTAI